MEKKQTNYNLIINFGWKVAVRLSALQPEARKFKTVLREILKRSFFMLSITAYLQGEYLTSILNKMWKGVRQEASGSFSGE